MSIKTSLKRQTLKMELNHKTTVKGATKSLWKIIFVSVTKISKNTSNILNSYFLNQIYTFTHETKYLHVGNYIYFS